MRRALRILAIVILLSSAICSSCRTQKQSTVEYADTVSVTATSDNTATTTDNILSIFTQSGELELSDVTLEFFPPDSLHPYPRPSPKSIVIGKAKSITSTDLLTTHTSAVDERKAETFTGQSSSTLHQASKSKSDVLRPSDFTIFFSVVGAILVLLVVIIIRYRSSGLK